MTLEDGKTFVVKANDNLEQNHFIQKTQLNGKAYPKTWLEHHEIQAGGVVEFSMGESPNTEWAVDEAARPFSMSVQK
jgi:putative alpha-1,2-mannosidase